MKKYIIHIKTDGTVNKHELKDKPSLKLLQELVGGLIETVPVRTVPGLTMIVNEEGKFMKLMINIKACLILRPLMWDVIVGDAVLVLEDGEDLIGMDSETADEILSKLLPEV